MRCSIFPLNLANGKTIYDYRLLRAQLDRQLEKDGKFNLLFVTMGNMMSKFINYADRVSIVVLAIMLIGLPAATVGFLAH